MGLVAHIAGRDSSGVLYALGTLLVVVISITVAVDFQRLITFADQVLRLEKYEKRIRGRLAKLGVSDDDVIDESESGISG